MKIPLESQGLIGISVCLLMVIFATLISLYSQAAGGCLILVSVVPILLFLSYFGVVSVTLTEQRLRYLLMAYVVFASCSGLLGALLHPTYAFYWSSFAWGSMASLALCVGSSLQMILCK